jgi:RNA-binding protein
VPKKAASRTAAPKKASKKAKKAPRRPIVPLSGKQKSHLRSLAHPLKPVVQIGHQGLTDGVVAALEVALERHELIKVKVSAEAEVEASELAEGIEKATHSQVAQIIGRTVVLYRRREQSPKIVLPRAKPQAARPVAPPIEDDGDDPPDAQDDEDEYEDEEDEEDELE